MNRPDKSERQRAHFMDCLRNSVRLQDEVIRILCGTAELDPFDSGDTELVIDAQSVVQEVGIGE